MEIRRETPEDIAPIRHMLKQAFDEPQEANLVDLLRTAGQARISLVAILNSQVVGHILYSPVAIDSVQRDDRAVGLAPLAVLPELQGKGIGSRLVRQGLDECRTGGYDIVVVLGDPTFFSRFGFSRASSCGLQNEYGVDEPFMAMELRSGGLAEVSGTVRFRPEFKEAGC